MRARPLPLLAALAIAGPLALVFPAAASAHDALADSSPTEGSTVEAVDEISLTFSDVLLDLGQNQRSTAIQVRHDGRYFETGCPTLAGTTASAPAALGDAGEYEVVWQVVASDGHPTSGTYTFTYSPAEGAAVAEGSPEPACSSASAQSGGADDDVILLAAAGGVVALAAVGVLAAVFLGRRRVARSRTAGGGDVGSSE